MRLVKIEPIWQPENQQQGFRGLLEAASYPGKVIDLAHALEDTRAELGVLACLVDDVVTFADPDERLSARERGLLGSACEEPETADYVLHDAALPPRPGYRPRLGTLYRPDSAATLILCGEVVGEGPLTLLLEGPGIETQTRLSLAGFHPDWFDARTRWVSNFPTGVDVILCDREHVAMLPRTCAAVKDEGVNG